MNYRKQHGFTLIEIAIVLLIISLLLGGIVKGQEMINSARVRSIANDISGIETAWISFQDRYRALPGDFDKAGTHIKENIGDGDGNAAVDSDAEEAYVWRHLSESGFISGSFAGEGSECQANVCPTNPFNGFYRISQTSKEITSPSSAYQISTGGSIPAKVLYELDLKIDDGVAGTGRLQGSDGDDCVVDQEWKSVDGGSDCTAIWLM